MERLKTALVDNKQKLVIPAAIGASLISSYALYSYFSGRNAK
jgi:hypothetical protein